MGQQSLLHPPSAALAGIHPTYILLGFSAALAAKFPPLLPVVESGSSNSEKSDHGFGFVSDSLVLTKQARNPLPSTFTENPRAKPPIKASSQPGPRAKRFEV